MDVFSDNKKNGISLRELLEHKVLSGSVPCRVDCGNTIDIRGLALFLDSINPVTVNIALDLRTEVVLRPFQEGYIKVTSQGFDDFQFRLSDAPLNSQIGLIAAILYHFNVHGVHIQIRSESPPRSGLGGSGALAVCIIAVLNDALIRLGIGYVGLNRIQQICLAQNLEEALGVARSGLQDQVAAVYGGVHQWTWDYRTLNKPFSGSLLVNSKSCDRLGRHLLVAYTGSPHLPSGLTQECLDDFLNGRVRDDWKRINQATISFADALRHSNWEKAIIYLNQECYIRMSLWPSIVEGVGKDLIESALRCKCGARFTGGGGGGCIWAIGEEMMIENLRLEWKSILENTQNGLLLEAKIAKGGLKLNHGI